MSVTYCECVFAALVIQNTKRMRRVTFSTVAVQWFSTLSINGTIFGKKGY
jgi:hypothetical protein